MKKLLSCCIENRARALAGGGVQTRIVQAKASDQGHGLSVRRDGERTS